MCVYINHSCEVIFSLVYSAWDAVGTSIVIFEPQC